MRNVRGTKAMIPNSFAQQLQPFQGPQSPLMPRIGQPMQPQPSPLQPMQPPNTGGPLPYSPGPQPFQGGPQPVGLAPSTPSGQTPGMPGGFHQQPVNTAGPLPVVPGQQTPNAWAQMMQRPHMPYVGMGAQ